jgi:hypothetical protein
MRYDIRAEFKGQAISGEAASGVLDFAVNAEDLDGAKAKAEDRLRETYDATSFDWRGQVVFVNHSPSF